MFEQLLIVIGAIIFGLLGIIHLFYTFFTNKFYTRNSHVSEAMKNTSPILTDQTTVWRAWIGFNASHSLGAILIFAFYFPLAVFNMNIILNSYWFSILPVIIGFAYLFLAKKYWFRIPFIGIFISTICFLIAALLINL